ncbi:MAG: DUF1822 family protein, partial [Xenococcaceae cyanobacterium]
MTDLFKNTRELRLLLPETIDLEPEDFDRARLISNRPKNEEHQWQIYLNALAQASLVKWLGDRMPDKTIYLDDDLQTEVLSKIRVDNFIISAIATEQILDEV